MSNVKSGVEESKDQSTQDNSASNFQNTKEAQVGQLVQILNYLFEPNNLSSNVYLVYRAQGATFHIPVKAIYDENSIKAVTTDKDVVNEALEQAENVVVIKKGDVIEAVKPARDQLQKNIIVKNIAKENEHEFKQLVYSYEGAKENILNCNYNNQLNVVTIICKDEHFATELYNFLNESQFQESALDCVLNFENLYISALENIKKKSKRSNDHQQNRYNMGMPMQQYPYQYQMPFFFNKMNPTYKGGYFQPPVYMQTPVFDNRQTNVMNMSYNPNLNGNVNNRQNNYNNNYNNNNKPYSSGLQRGGFKQRGGRGSRGGRGGYTKGGNRESHQQQTKVEVNDSDFPPLSNDQEGQQ